MWIPQFGDRLCEFCGEMGGCQEMGCVMCVTAVRVAKL